MEASARWGETAGTAQSSCPSNDRTVVASHVVAREERRLGHFVSTFPIVLEAWKVRTRRPTSGDMESEKQ